MIEEIEELMQHWGNQFNQVGDGGGLGSPMATIMEWGGSAPRGTPGSRDLMMASGGGMDHAAMEVAAALPRDTGAPEPGQYRTDRTPYAREPMRCLSPAHPCRRVVTMVASQLMKTQIALNWMGGLIHMAPSNILALLPSLSLSKRVSGRISKTIKATPELAKRVAASRSRDARN